MILIRSTIPFYFNKKGTVLKVLSHGTNCSTDSIMTIHAEVDAILKAKKKSKKQKYDLADADMYVVRIGSIRMDYPLKYSRPCPDCAKAISKHGLRRVYYSTNKEFYDCCGKTT